MKRLLLSAALVFVAFLVGHELYIALAGDETRIHWLFSEEAGAFNSASTFSVLSSFAPDYEDETTGATLQALRAAVLWTFQNRRDAQHEFVYRVELPERAVCSIEGPPG